MNITAAIYTDETSARKHLEMLRWPNGVTCALCGGTERVKALGGKSMGDGWYHCGDCRRKFTVRTGSIMERSHIALHKWVLATHLLCASKKGMSAHQLHRMIGTTYKTAWFLFHRIREGMIDTNAKPMGGPGQPVQADETYFGTKDAVRGLPEKKKKGHANKRSVVGLVAGGKSRMFAVERADTATVTKILRTNADMASTLHTDESSLYKKVGPEFAKHETVNHYRKEWARDGVHTNNIEGYFGIFKRGMKGVYQHCAEKHLQRYLNEFDFRYNSRELNDFERAQSAHKGGVGKRLTYRRTYSA